MQTVQNGLSDQVCCAWQCVVCGGQFKVVDSATSGSAWYGREAANLMLPFTGFLCKDLLLTVFSTLDVDLCNRLDILSLNIVDIVDH